MKSDITKKLLTICTITGFIPVFLTGCGGSAAQQAGDSSAMQDSVVSEMLISELSDATQASGISDPGISFKLPRMIKQRETVFGDNGCSGAAGLMALQAAGCLIDLDTQEEYSQFWSSIPVAADATAGFNGNGIWNPAYAQWLSTFADAERVEDFTAEDIKQYLTDGYVVIVLVSLGESGKTTHWMTVTGWKTENGILLYEVADPWSGVLHEFTASRLQKRMDEGAKRKGDFGSGYETDGVLIKVN